MWTKKFQMFKLYLEKERNQTSNCQHPLDHRKSKRIKEKHLLLCHWLRQCLWVDHNKLWTILKEMGIPDHLTCLLRNLYAGQEATVRTRHGTMEWFQTGKGVRQGYILSPCLFNLYTEYIMRNINNLRYADDTTLMAESEEKLKSLLMKMKEERKKAGLKFNIQNTKIWHPVPSLHGK